MDPRLLKYYNRELQHIREMGGEFAREYPKIAGRLGLEGFECADPYVERLLEGFGFLAARIQMKLDAEFPQFTQHLLEMVYPHYLAPTPSMAVVQFQPDLTEGSLAEGVPLPRGTVLKSLLGKGDQTPCEYRTAHDLELFPLEVAEARYYPGRDVAALGLPDLADVKGAIRLRLRTTGGQPFSEIALDRLPLFLRGPDELPMRILEQMLGNALAVVVKSAGGGDKHVEVLERSHVGSLGFADEESLLPADHRSFQGYRLLQEYFAFPERFRFVEFRDIGSAVRRIRSDTLDIVVALDRTQSALEDAVDASNFVLFCSPAINLFPKRADRIHLTVHDNEYHVVPDRTRPMDFEVHDIVELEGHGATAEERQEFLRFYALHDRSADREHQAYYMIRRLPRVLSAAQRRSGPRSHYVGHEVFVSLVDAAQAPFHPDLRQLSLRVLCTNRDLPLHMPVGKGTTDFSLEEGAPVEAARCLAGPTMPRPTQAVGETAWRLINHLSLNYLSLIDNDRQSGAAALRELLQIYGDTAEPIVRKQVEGVRSVRCRPVTRRLRAPGPITFGRGLEVALTLDEAAFEGTGVFLLGAVLEQFFSRYVSINSFTETVVNTVDRGEVMRWPMRTGRRHTL